MAVTQTTQIDPTIQPFLSYGLGEAQRLYQAGGPQFFTGDTFVRPSETTQTGLQALEQRARMGNPLLGSAQQQLQREISGDFLGGNPLTRQGQQVTSGVQETSNLQNLLGTAATIGGLYKNVGGLQGARDLYNAGTGFLRSFSTGGWERPNFLTGQYSGDGF